MKPCRDGPVRGTRSAAHGDGRARRRAPGARAASLVILAVAVLAALARTIPTTWLPAIAVASLAPYLLLAAPVAAVPALVARARLLAAAALAVTVLAVVWELPLYLPSGAAPGGAGTTVLTANLRHGRAEPGALVRRVRSAHVDLAVFEELTRAEAGRLHDAGLDALLPHHAVRIGREAGGVGIWSRYRIGGVTPHPGFRLGALSAELESGPGPAVHTRVLAVHVTAPVGGGAPRWARDLGRLHDLMAAEGPGRVVVAGDFNATYGHPRFRALLTGGYRASCEDAGAGLCRSFPTDRSIPAVLGIDHVVTRGFRAVDARTVALPGSDHRALLVSTQAPTS